MKKLLLTFIILILYLTPLFSQNKNQETKDLKFELEKTKAELKNRNLELYYLKNNIEESYKNDEANLKEWVKQQNSHLEDIISKYALFATVILGLIGFCINFFGKDAIRKRVEQLIEDKASDYAKTQTDKMLNSKITDDFITETIRVKAEIEITKLVEDLKLQGNTVITEIENKANAAINAINSPPPQIELDGGDEDFTVNGLFNMAYNTENLNAKIILYKKLLEKDSGNFRVYNNIGVAYKELGNFDEAIEYYNKAVSLNPEYATALTNRAAIYITNRMFDKALEDVNKAIDLGSDTEDEFALFLKSSIYAGKGDIDKAVITLNSMIQKYPESPTAHFNRGHLLSDYGKYVEAEKSYKEAEKLNFPIKAQLYNNIAVLYRRIKKYDLAKEYIEKARKDDPNFPNLDGTLALIYADCNETELFYKHLKIALDKKCHVWNYLDDPGFDDYRDSPKLKMLLDAYRP